MKIAIRNSLLSSIEPPPRGTARFISLRLQLRQVQLSICAPRFVLLQKNQRMSSTKRYLPRSIFSCWGLQCSSWSGPRLLVPQDRPLWRWEIKREWTNTFGAMFIPRYVCNKYILPHQACPPSILETPMIVSLAPSESRDHSKITAE